MKTENRLDARLYTVTHDVEDGDGRVVATHVIDLQVGRDPDTGAVVEVAFAGRGKAGHGVDQLLSDAGLWVSRLVQGRDPETGEELPAEGPPGRPPPRVTRKA